MQNDTKVVGQAGVTGFTAFVINVRFGNGAQPIKAFKTIIDDELSRQFRFVAK